MLDIQDKNGNSALLNAINNLEQGQIKIKLIKEMINKFNADYTLQNNDGNNSLIMSAHLGNNDLLGIIFMKMLHDEANSKPIGSKKLSSDDVCKLRNKKSDDVLNVAIRAKSKDCIKMLIEVANMTVTKEHLSLAKESINESNNVYLLVKWFYELQDNEKLNHTGQQSRNNNVMKPTEEVKGKVKEYYIKNKLGSKTQRDYNNTVTSEQMTFENTKVTNRLKDTLENIKFDQSNPKNDKDEIMLM